MGYDCEESGNLLFGVSSYCTICQHEIIVIIIIIIIIVEDLPSN